MHKFIAERERKRDARAPERGDGEGTLASCLFVVGENNSRVSSHENVVESMHELCVPTFILKPVLKH